MQLIEDACPVVCRLPVVKDRSEAAILKAMLPTDGHVHAEWSWDCEPGDMETSSAVSAVQDTI